MYANVSSNKMLEWDMSGGRTPFVGDVELLPGLLEDVAIVMLSDQCTTISWRLDTCSEWRGWWWVTGVMVSYEIRDDEM